jgi:hypothetical protein
MRRLSLFVLGAVLALPILSAIGRADTGYGGGGGGASLPFSDASNLLFDSLDATKLFRFDLSGITTGNTVVFKVSGTSGAPILDFNVNGTGTLKNSFGGSSLAFTNAGGAIFNAQGTSGGNNDLKLQVGGVSRIESDTFVTMSTTSGTQQTIFAIATASNTGGGGNFHYTCWGKDASNNIDTETDTLNFSWSNKAGALTSTGNSTSPGGSTPATGSAQNSNTGTFLGTPNTQVSGTTLNVTLAPTWTSYTPTGVTCYGTFINNSTAAVTAS